MTTISSDNSQSPLTASFTGTLLNVSKFSSISVAILCNLAGTLTIRQSPNGNVWTKQHVIPVVAETYLERVYPLLLKYASVTWVVDAGTPNTTSWLQTKLHTSHIRSTATTWNNVDVDETGVVVSAGATYITSINASNSNAAIRYLKLYNKATAATSSDTPIMTIGLPGVGAQDFMFAYPIYCTTGVSVRATTGSTASDTGAPSANDVVVTITYF